MDDSTLTPVQKSGFVHLKFPSKSYGIRIKTWKRKWVTVNQMSDLSKNKSVAKLEIYNEKDSNRKHSILLESVHLIKRSKSRTMLHAFDIIDEGHVLRIGGDSETDVQQWIAAFRDIFWPIKASHLRMQHGTYEVSVIDNANAEDLGINGRYFAQVSPYEIRLLSTEDGAVVHQWKITSLKRFLLTSTIHQCDQKKILAFVATRTPTKDENYVLFCEKSEELLHDIKNNVDVAFERKRNGNNESWDKVSQEPIHAFGHFPTDHLSTTPQTLVGLNADIDEDYSSTEEYSQLNFHKRHSVRPTNQRSSTFSGRQEFDQVGRNLHHSHSADQLTVKFKCPETDEYFMDDAGYSHLPAVLQGSKDSLKTRSFSSSSSVSQKSNASRQSRDSGIAILKYTAEETAIADTQSGSFDSACLTSDVDDLYQVLPDNQLDPIKGQEGDFSEKPIRVVGYENIEISTKVDKSNATDSHILDRNYENVDIDRGSPRVHEELYEDLDSLPKRKDLNSLLGVDRSMNLHEGNKKNLGRFLGFDEKDKEMPPSLPERPSSSKMQRKRPERLSKTKGKWSNIPLFNLRPTEVLRGRSVSTSSSGSEDEVNVLIKKMGVWDEVPISPSRHNEFKAPPTSLAQQAMFKMSSHVVRNSLYADVNTSPLITNEAVPVNPRAINSEKQQTTRVCKSDNNINPFKEQSHQMANNLVAEPPTADLLSFDEPTSPIYQNAAVCSTIIPPRIDNTMSKCDAFWPFGSPGNHDPFDSSWAQPILTPTKTEVPVETDPFFFDLDTQSTCSPTMSPTTPAPKYQSFFVEDDLLFNFDSISTSRTPVAPMVQTKTTTSNPFVEMKEVDTYVDMTQPPQTLADTADFYMSMSNP